MGIFSSYGVLSQEKIQIAQRLSSLRGGLAYGATNALFELISGANPPGAQQILFKPHDHCWHGVSLARNSQFSFARSTLAATWILTCTLANTYYHFDRNGSATQFTHDQGVPDIMLYVTPGIDSIELNVASSPCCLEARIVVYASAGITDIRIHNRNTKSASVPVQTTTSGSVVRLSTITNIPCRGGVWNPLDIEIKNDTAGAQVEILDVNIVETRGASQPLSNGSATLVGAVKP